MSNKQQKSSLFRNKFAKKFLIDFMIEPSDRISFYEDMALGLENGVGVQEIVKDIDFFYRETENPLFIMTEEIQSGIASGANLSVILRKWFPEEDVFLIDAAEKKGLDEQVFKDLNEIISESERLKALFKKELMPQMMTLIVTLLFIVGFSVFLMPGFATMIAEKDRTPLVANYFAFSQGIMDYGVYFAVIIAGFIGSVIWSIKNLTGSLRDKIDKFPPWSVYREFQASNFLILLSGMLKAGIPTNAALELLNKNAGPYLKRHIKKIRKNLAQGNRNEGEAFDTGFFSNVTAYKIKTYASRSGLANGLYLLGSNSVKDLSIAMEKVVKIIGKTVGALSTVYIIVTGQAMYDIIKILMKSANF